jgi:hypothetical protein
MNLGFVFKCSECASNVENKSMCCVSCNNVLCAACANTNFEDVYCESCVSANACYFDEIEKEQQQEKDAIIYRKQREAEILVERRNDLLEHFRVSCTYCIWYNKLPGDFLCQMCRTHLDPVIKYVKKCSRFPIEIVNLIFKHMCNFKKGHGYAWNEEYSAFTYQHFKDPVRRYNAIIKSIEHFFPNHPILEQKAHFDEIRNKHFFNL